MEQLSRMPQWGVSMCKPLIWPGTLILEDSCIFERLGTLMLMELDLVIAWVFWLIKDDIEGLLYTAVI